MDSQSTNLENSGVEVKPQTNESLETKPNNNWITVLAMALFVVFSFCVVGFLYYQNQQLKEMLAKYQSSSTSTPVATSLSTANWKTYPSETIVGLKYSFKYPTEAKLVEAQDRSIFTIRENELTHIYNGKNNDIENIMDSYQPFGSTEITFSNTQPITIGNLEGYKTTGTNLEGISTYYFLREENLPGVLIFSFESNENETEELLMQILSTFKAVEIKSIIEPKACTLEAKMCSDGSYVGRTGPNCEFAPCPTPKP